MWLKFSWVLWLPGLRFMFVTPFPLSVPGPDTSLSVCTYGSAHPVEWPLCLLLAVPPRDVSIPTAGCSAPTAHNSVSVCPGRKQLPCGGDEKSRANTFWISASGQINFNLNCHHKGLFFPFPFLWVVSLIYISEWGKWSPFGAKFSFFMDFQLQNPATFILVNVVAFWICLGVLFYVVLRTSEIQWCLC